MNSMSEMHAEIEARDRARHEKELGRATPVEEFSLLKQQLDSLKEQTTKLKSRLKHKTEHRGSTKAVR